MFGRTPELEPMEPSLRKLKLEQLLEQAQKKRNGLWVDAVRVLGIPLGLVAGYSALYAGVLENRDAHFLPYLFSIVTGMGVGMLAGEEPRILIEEMRYTYREIREGQRELRSL